MLRKSKEDAAAALAAKKEAAAAAAAAQKEAAAAKLAATQESITATKEAASTKIRCWSKDATMYDGILKPINDTMCLPMHSKQKRHS